jgi:molybdopterin converting factor small subunit
MTTSNASADSLEVQLFGGFRQFVPSGTLLVETGDAKTVADLRREVERAFGDDDNALMLLKASAFATDRRVLDDESERFPSDEPLSVLPPVCGG